MAAMQTLPIDPSREHSVLLTRGAPLERLRCLHSQCLAQRTLPWCAPVVHLAARHDSQTTASLVDRRCRKVRGTTKSPPHGEPLMNGGSET